MELCDEVYRSLQLLKDDKLISQDELKELLSLVCRQLNGEPNGESNELNRLDHNRKKLFIAIYCLYLETCRLNASLESELNELRSVLEHVAMLESSRRLLIDTYRNGEFRKKLIGRLATLRLDCEQPFIDQFKAIELTKDSVVKSSRKTDYRHICQTEYLMGVQTEATKHLLTCSIQDIESMSGQLKEIMKTVDRLFTTVVKK